MPANCRIEPGLQGTSMGRKGELMELVYLIDLLVFLKIATGKSTDEKSRLDGYNRNKLQLEYLQRKGRCRLF